MMHELVMQMPTCYESGCWRQEHQHREGELTITVRTGSSVRLASHHSGHAHGNVRG